MREIEIGEIHSPLQADFDNLADSVRATLGSDFALITLKESSELYALGLPSNLGRTHENRFGIPCEALCLDVIRTNAPLVLTDAQLSPEYQDLPFVRNGTWNEK